MKTTYQNIKTKYQKARPYLLVIGFISSLIIHTYAFYQRQAPEIIVTSQIKKLQEKHQRDLQAWEQKADSLRAEITKRDKLIIPKQTPHQKLYFKIDKNSHVLAIQEQPFKP